MAAATLSYVVNSEDLWVGTEFLRTYTDDGARRAMNDLRRFIGRCPAVESSSGNHRFAVAPGPRLGDDSLHVTYRTMSDAGPLRWDSMIVRTGTALVVVQEEGNTSGDDHLARVADAALRRYQTTGS